MTRPGGTTPNRGLPYPGSANLQADTPKALQNLAEAIEAQLSSLGGGVIFDTYTGTVTVGVNVGQYTGQFDVPFPKLATVLGSMVSYGTFAGGDLQPGWVVAPGESAGYVASWRPERWGMVTAYNYTFPNPYSFAGKTISICALGWGYPHA